MKSTFEKMAGTYTLGADGIYYPNLVSIDEEPHYGKYGMLQNRLCWKNWFTGKQRAEQVGRKILFVQLWCL